MVQSSEDELYVTIASLRTTDETRRFLRDLCTRSELEAMAHRWEVAKLLAQLGSLGADIMGFLACRVYRAAKLNIPFGVRPSLRSCRCHAVAQVGEVVCATEIDSEVSHRRTESRRLHPTRPPDIAARKAEEARGPWHLMHILGLEQQPFDSDPNYAA